MSQTIDTPSYTIELSDGSIRPMTVKELAIRLEQLMSADKGIKERGWRKEKLATDARTKKESAATLSSH